MNTLDYYNQHADEFCDNTLSADVSDLYSRFESRLPKGASVIDLGCGSGRDSRHFLEAGYLVTAIDGSEELCKLASRLLGIPVWCILFSELDYEAAFDAAWACASLLHVPKNEMPEIMQKICRALKPGGIFYASFKYGEHERESGGRFFADYTEKDIGTLTGCAPELKCLEYWLSADVRIDHPNDKWLNIIWRSLP